MILKHILLTAFSLSTIGGAYAQNSGNMKNINTHAPVQCTKTILINATPAKVWSVITNIDQWVNWQTDIPKAKLNGTLNPNTPFIWKTGGATIHSKLHTVEPYNYFGWTGKTFGMYAIHNWTLTEENGQTRVTVNESMQGFLAGVLKKSFNRNLEKDMQHWLDLLKKECEK